MSTNQKLATKLVYKDLSYEIVGVLFETYNELGYGFREKHYQAIFAEKLKERKLKFEKEKYSFKKYNGKVVAKYFIDFVIEKKIAIEIKVSDRFYQSHMNQLLSYLVSEN